MKTRPDLSSKSYYRCLICPRFRKICGGKPTRDMDNLSLCEYLGDVMDYFGLSVSYVAEKSGASEKTVERIKYRQAGQDFMRGTIRMVEQVVLGHVGEHICYLDSGANAELVEKLLAELAVAKEEAAYWRKENDRKAKIIDKYLDS